MKEQTSAFRAEGALKAVSQSSPVLSMKWGDELSGCLSKFGEAAECMLLLPTSANTTLTGILRVKDISE